MPLSVYRPASDSHRLSALCAPTTALLAVLLTTFFLCFPSSVTAQQNAPHKHLAACQTSDASGQVMARVQQRGSVALSLCEGHALAGGRQQTLHGEPVALTSADLDEDGVPDLISAFASDQGGTIAINRGNIQALWPYGAAAVSGPPEAFFPTTRTFTVPERPDFVVAGDFDADGHWDILTAQRGSTALYFLKGDGHGALLAPRRIDVSGSITALIAGEINRPDGLTDVIVAVATSAGARALVYESPRGAIKAQPEIFNLPHPATALALGRFDGGAIRSLAIGAGNQLMVIHGRDRKLSLSAAQQADVKPANITQQELSFSVSAIVAGDFTGTGPSLAALGNDNRVHILEGPLSKPLLSGRALEDPSFVPSMQVAKQDKEPAVAGTVTPGTAAKLAVLRAAGTTGETAWTERSAVDLPSGFSQKSPQLITARVAGSQQEDLLALDTGNRQVHVLSTEAIAHHTTRTGAAAAASITPQRVPMKLTASLQAQNEPAAVLPMRLGRHGLNGLVMLQAGSNAPVLMPHDVPPDNVFIVTNTSDQIIAVGPQYTGPDGSLRKALYDAGQADGTSSIEFNIPTSDPGYNAATGTFLIQPLSESVAGSLNNFALPPINATITLDGYTQPGASPNTLANADNAKILIQIDGSKATTPGGSGMSPFEDVGSVYRGLDFTGWINPEISQGSSGSTASGAEGLEANGVQDFIEGNFFGTDPTGKLAMPNRIGIFADNGPGIGSTSGGNIIGGTTPQARNILSGNNNSGILFLSTAVEGQLQGNFVGLDATGKAIVSNPQEADRSNTFDGAGLNGATVTIGGTLPGTANVIAGNGTNVDINDLTEGGQANNSIVQGNLIGTDATGTVSIPNEGYGVSILHNPTDMLIGGTTPAARNIISGNLTGVYIFDNSFNNTVQGNYIGLDITGAKAVANLHQGFITGATDSSEIAAGNTMIGGSVPGAGNVISGNTLDAIQISGTSTGQYNAGQTLQGNTILGNFIGTDATGKNAVPNGGSGVDLISSATNNVIGGSAPGSGNLIANNQGDGVLIDPGTAVAGEGFGNNTIANSILSNGGTGVRIKSGTNNRISQNSIYQNGALGIDVDVAGPNANTHCNSSNSGANNLQNSPVLTAGSGKAFITATATDPNGNTSEFSNAVQESLSGSVIDLLGNFDSTPNTTYTIEFFSSPVADPSGFGQGQTYLTSTTATTDANCGLTISNPIDTTKADVSVTLKSSSTQFQVGPDFGYYDYTATVVNNGPATAHNVVFTETLPAGEQISSTYCNVASCQSPVVTSLGACTVKGNKITCNLGTMAPGATAQITLPVEATAPGTLTVTATVSATEADPVPANNTASLDEAVNYPYPFIDHLDPTSALTQTTGSLTLTIYGTGFIPTSAVTFNGTPVPTTGYLDNQVCGGPFEPSFCSAIQVSVPASLLGSAGTPTVEVTNPDPGPDGGSNFPSDATFTLVSSCTFDVEFFGFNPIDKEGDTLIPEQVEVTTNAPTCAWSATSDSTWLVILDHQTGVGTGSVDVAVAPNTGAARSGHITIQGQSVEIDQEAGDSTVCSYSLNPSSKNFPAAGGNGTFAVTTDSSCSYFVVAQPDDGTSFVTIPQSSGLLVGSANPVFTVAANHGAPRSNTILVGGDVFTITQDAPPCYYTLSTYASTVGVAGGTGSITVTPSSSSCAWTAKSSDPAHLAVTSGTSATGNGTVKYSVPVNTGGPQMPTITIGDGTGYSIFTLTQVSAFTCTFTITPAAVNVPSDGVSNYFTVIASYSSCQWTAVSSDPTALSIGDVTGSSGLSTNGSSMGSGAVYYRVSQNTTGAPRTFTITAGCQTFTVNQGPALASNPVPVITSILPTSVTAGSGALTLTVTGSNFVQGSTVNFNGTARSTTYVSATQLTAAILAADVNTAGTFPITVTNPSPGGGTSNSVTFTVTSSVTNNPVPTITTLQPSSVTAGSGATTLTINGTNFVSGSVVNYNGTAKTTTYVSATKLTAALLATDVATAGTYPVTVTNPTPGGGTSNSVNFTVTTANNPVPTITTLQPSSVTAGSGATTLTINGTNFVSGSVVNYNGTAKTTTYVSATKLTAALLATDVATAGTYPVTVTNPTPGGGTSNSVNFTVNAPNNPVPTISTLQPSSVTAGSGATTLTINGTNFVSGSVVNYNGTAKTTTYVSATKLTAALLATDVATAGTYPVTVTNPTPGGGTSNSVNFTVNAPNNPVPTITTLQPSSVTAGSGATTLTINGTNFISGSVVNYNGTAKITTYVSATKLTAALLATDVATAGTYPVTVTNPTPGGGTSNSVNFTVTTANNPVPTITTLQPSSVTAGSGATTLTINGTNFVSGSVMNYNGTAKTTTYVSATKLTAALLATDVATAGTYPVTVTNPTPGGGTSNSVNFTVNAPNNPVPTITTLQPSSVNAGSGATTLTINGTNFVSGSVVNYNGTAKTTTFVSATKLTAALLATDVATAGTYPVTVTNPTPGGGTSNSVNFTVNAPNNPVPTITTLQPSSVTAGSGATSLTINGTNFVSGSIVNYNGTAKTTTFVSATKLTAALLATDVATAGTYPVTVTNPTPGGGTSNSVNFTVNTEVTNNPVPTITTLQPSSVTAGSGATTLTINGTNFISSSTVTYNGASKTTTYVSSTQLTAALLATDVATAGTYPVTVTNPTPGGGTSNSLNFTVNAVVAPAPQVSFNPTSLAFPSTPATDASSPLTVTLTNSGNATLNLTGITITGTNASAFAETNTCTATLAAAGSCTISVTFTPPSTGSFSASLSVADDATGSPQTVALSGTGTVAPTFTISSTTPTQTVSPGGSAQYSITVSAQNGDFAGSVALTATGLPPGATASFSQPSVSPGSTSATSILTIQTAASTPAVAGFGKGWTITGALLPMCALFLAIRKRRTAWPKLAMLVLISLAAAATLTGCGGGFNFISSTPTTYTVTVTGTNGQDVQSTTVQIIVK